MNLTQISVMAAAVVAVVAIPAEFIGLRAATVAVTPVADGILWALDPALTRGSEVTLVSGTTGANVGNTRSRAVVRFDLSAAIPPGAVVRSATLTVTVVKVPQGGAPSTFELRRVLQP